MEIVFIRHGQPTYQGVEACGYIGHGFDLAELTEAGREQARQAAADKVLDGIELIVASPYTRALQTAAIISRIRNVEIAVELGLHEWMPDLTFTYSAAEQSHEAARLLMANDGICPADSPVRYEEAEAVFQRANRCLPGYLHLNKIAVVSHGFVIQQFTGQVEIDYCERISVEYDKGFTRRRPVKAD